MKIKSFLLFSVCFSISFLQAQTPGVSPVKVGWLKRHGGEFQKLDDARLKLLFRFAYYVTDRDKLSQLTDTTVLFVGDTYSVYYNWKAETIAHIRKDFEKDVKNVEYAESVPYIDFLEKTDNKPDMLRYDSDFSHIYKNRSTRQLTTIDMISDKGIDFYRVEENLQPQMWELHPDTIAIMGYSCRKATCNFRGRKYTGWYAPDIPVDDGPYKFCGLPGMILKLEDSERLFSFDAIGLEISENTWIVMDEKSGMIVSSPTEYKKVKQRTQETETIYAIKGRVLYETKRKLSIKFIPIEK